ncbi:MAG TPA: MBL fold metallo-hydrolase [Candidatus Xenobia bacterium]|nr:MBL fold metallo-hydrolase [Candidatus Xenobia bacterium]
MTRIDEIAANVYRLSIYVSSVNLLFNHFLVKDDEPLLFHTGYRWMFPELREAVVRVLDPAKIRWVSFSHFESDECGSLNQWLEVAPQAQPACTFLAATLNVNDFALRPPRALQDSEVLATGKFRFRSCHTAHLPHGWDAGVLFEETQQTLFCSDLFLQFGEVEPRTESDILGRVRDGLLSMQAGPLAYVTPYTARIEHVLKKLAELKPKTLATMHGSTWAGDGAGALRELAAIMKETLGPAELGP